MQRDWQPTQPKAPKAKPVRYWPGKAPDAAEAGSSDEEDSNTQQKIQDSTSNQESVAVLSSSTNSTKNHPSTAPNSRQHAAAGPNVVPTDDPRLKRIMQSRAERGGEDRRRNLQREDEGDAPKIGRLSLSTAGPDPKERASDDEDEDEDDEEAALARRQRLKAIAAQRQREEELAAQEEEEEEEEEEDDDEEESEYTTDSEDDTPRAPLLKPVFIPKALRETMLEKERLEQEEKEAEEQRQRELEERKKESQKLLEEQLLKAEAEAKINEEPLDVDDTDGLNEDEEYNAWKLRELIRIKRDKEERDKEEQEEAEKERRRNMTDEELIAEKERLNPTEEKAKYRYMQKYYHKGAFYNEEDIMQRDYNEPTLEDKVDKSILPSVMQVKRFGRSGQTKWTHLTNEDTSINKQSAWFQQTDVNSRTVAKMAGMKQSFQKPTGKRRKMD